MRCSGCRWYEPFGLRHGSPIGFCHVSPPEGGNILPSTSPHNYCRKYEGKDADPIALQINGWIEWEMGEEKHSQETRDALTRLQAAIKERGWLKEG